MHITVLGQDSHRVLTAMDPAQPLKLGGYTVPDALGFEANSDGDILLHSLTNAISNLTGEIVLGAKADELCLEQNITDSSVYLKYALAELTRQARWKIDFVSFSIQAKRPKLLSHLPAIRASIAELLDLSVEQVFITCTTGEGLTGMGRGEGMEALCLLSASSRD